MKKNEDSLKSLGWLAIGITLLIILIVISSTTLVDVGFNLSTILLIVAIGLIGLFMTIVGVYYLVNAINLSKYGKKCYGRVEDIEESLSYDNRPSNYIFTFLIINPDTLELETYKKLITYDIKKYSIGSYILCKKYKKNIDEIRAIQNNEAPLSVREQLERMSVDPTRKIEISNDREYITIDNIKYKRI